jgi:hypothetical protein
MMQSILSLINETLTTSSAPKSENTPKSGTRGEFESILTHQDHESARCTSATRIKARANSIEENGDSVSADDESDDEDATTCVNVDDYAAWGLTHTIAAPPPSMKNPSVSMVAVKMPKPSPAPQPLPAMHSAGETIPAAALAPKTQEFMAPMTQEMPSVKDDEPSSKAITREFPTPTAATRTQEMPAAQQTSSYIEKLARSANATDIPPPSAIPMVSGAPPANAVASNRAVAIPPNHAPVIQMTPRSANNNNKPNTKSNDGKLASVSSISQSSSATFTDAALRPTVLAMPIDTRIPIATTPTRMLATMDIQAEAQAQTEARQQAVDNAVNQLTLSRTADGELDVPELGRVRVEAQSRNGEVDVRITAAREETQALVSNHTHEIVIDAKAAAIPIVDLRVKLDPRAEPTDFSSFNHSSNNGQRGNSRNDNSSEKQAPNARGNSRARFVL